MFTGKLEDVVAGAAVKPYPMGEIGVMFARDGAGAAADGGDAGKGAGDKGQARTYTDEDLNRILSNERRKYEERFDTFKTEVSPKLSKYEELEKKYGELQTVIDELRQGQPEPKEGDADPIEQLLREIEPPKGYQTKEARELFRAFKRRDILTSQQIDDLQALVKSTNEKLTALEAAKQQSDAEKEQARLAAIAADRTARISTIIAQLPIADPDVAESWLDRKVRRNEKSGRLELHVNEDTILPFSKENVDKYLPASLRKAAVDAGGSGAGGSRTTPNPASVETLRDQLDRAKAAGAAAKNSAERDKIAGQIMRLKRQIKEADPTATV